MRRITSPLSIDGDVPDYMNKTNVKLVSQFVNETMWDYVFSIRDDNYTLEGFLKAVGKFPAFCGENNRKVSALESCKREVATFFAHVV